MPDRLAEAERLMALVELLYRARKSAAEAGVLPAEAAVQRVVLMGHDLRAAVARAKAAPDGPEREAALASVERVGEQISSDIDGRWEDPAALFSVLLDGIAGRRTRRPYR